MERIIYCEACQGCRHVVGKDGSCSAANTCSFVRYPEEDDLYEYWSAREWDYPNDAGDACNLKHS